MMPLEVIDNVAGTLVAKQALGEIVRTSVRTPLDEHYFVVVMHKGVSAELQHLSFNDLAQLLACPAAKIYSYIAEHAVNGSARGGCKICLGASEELKRLLVDEKNRNFPLK